MGPKGGPRHSAPPYAMKSPAPRTQARPPPAHGRAVGRVVRAEASAQAGLFVHQHPEMDRDPEERGIGQAIAQNLLVMLEIAVPFIVTVIGEGGSGGALAIGVGDRILMLENSTYSVASPEAAAAILWRDASQASTAAVSMHITAPDLLDYGVIDEIIPEPEGGAHADPTAALDAVRDAIARHLSDLQTRFDVDTPVGARRLLEARRAKFRNMGRFIDTDEPSVSE